MTGRRRLRRLVCAAAAFAAAAALAACGDAAVAPATPGAAAAADDTARAEAAERRFLAEIDRSRGFRDCFLPLRDPAFVAADGAHGLVDGEVVVGLDLGGVGAGTPPVAFAYPIQYLNFHEIVEHTVPTADGGLHLLACW